MSPDDRLVICRACAELTVCLAHVCTVLIGAREWVALVMKELISLAYEPHHRCDVC